MTSTITSDKSVVEIANGSIQAPMTSNDAREDRDSSNKGSNTPGMVSSLGSMAMSLELLISRISTMVDL